MSDRPDWSQLEGSVQRAAERLRALQEENSMLRAEVARLEHELDRARAATSAAGASDATRTAEVRRRLDRLEGEIQSLLQTPAG